MAGEQRGQTGATRVCCVRGMSDRTYGRESGGKHGAFGGAGVRGCHFILAL